MFSKKTLWVFLYAPFLQRAYIIYTTYWLHVQYMDVSLKFGFLVNITKTKIVKRIFTFSTAKEKKLS